MNTNERGQHHQEPTTPPPPTPCLICVGPLAANAFQKVCDVDTCELICAVCEECLDTFEGLPECLDVHAYCSDHHPVRVLIQTPPSCAVKDCPVTLPTARRNVFKCARRGHPNVFQRLVIGVIAHRNAQTHLWLQENRYLDGRVAPCDPVWTKRPKRTRNGSSSSIVADTRNTRKRRHYTKTAAAIEDSITTHGQIWDDAAFELSTLDLPCRKRIVTFLLNQRSRIHTQRVICTCDWFAGWDESEELLLTDAQHCVGCGRPGIQSHPPLFGHTLWTCPSVECVNFWTDFQTGVTTEYAVTHGAARPESSVGMYLTAWGQQSLAHKNKKEQQA